MQKINPPIELTNMLKCQLIFFIVSKLSVSGEWVEMPQFSADSKVYKSSVHSHASFYNEFFHNDRETVPEHDVATIAQMLHEFGNADGNTSGKILSQSLEAATVYPEILFKESSVDDEVLTGEVESSTTPVPLTLELPIEESSATTASPILPVEESHKTSSSTEDCRNETIEGLRFQDYLPMEILKKVHQTLRSQPSTMKGKIGFLKKFERDLIAEIEERLGNALSPLRRTRGTHDYDHDDEMGFPSLEGALMAISFLTFAVYLVRLVMLLFRNANNNTTTAGTIFFGRNRRSTETLNDKTDEILKYLNSFKGNL